MPSPLSSSRIRALVSLTVQKIFTPPICVLLAIGSVILGLVWVFLDFFAGMAVIDVYSWLPLIVLLAVIALLMTEKWLTTALTIPLVIGALAGLYYLLLLIGSLVWLPTPIIGARGMILLILLNRSVFWDDPSKRWWLSDLFPYEDEEQKLTLAPPLSIPLQDASRLKSSIVDEIRSPKTVAEVIQAVRDARSTHRKISLSGIRHSMGGQALGSNTLHLDMTHMDSVRYNDSDQTVTIGPGATWRQIQTTLSQHGRAVRVMQDSNIFSVGGSLSVNAHGEDPRYGSLIESVTSLKLVTADGREIQCDRTHQKDLFSAVIGGYGILGIITEVNLATTQNSSYVFSLISIQTHALLETLESLGKNPANRLLEAHLSVDSERFLTENLALGIGKAPHPTGRSQNGKQKYGHGCSCAFSAKP